jgi:NADH-quinone oxidoreductase subunit J
VFCNAAGLLILLEVEFLAMIFLVVYVGAIAVLFLFVVMMLNIKLIELNENLLLYLPIGIFIALIFLFEIFIIIDTDLIPLFSLNFGDILNYINWTSEITYTTNIARLGNLLYTHYFFLFLIASMILLVAMIGAIMLTLYRNLTVKRQEIYQQISRDFNKTILLKYLK